MATGSADGFFRYVYDGCLSGGDMGIERRPYHRNCRCALHNKSKDNCPHGMSKCKNVSYPIRRAWSEGCLSLAAVAANSCHSSPSSSPSLQHHQQQQQQPIGRCGTQLDLCNEEEEEQVASFSSTTASLFKI
ncbi:uncharacterized protein LOC8262857 [Ricinus communis]|uniref:Uncharacterized protein n=1 Tax=Ricinus communis TaxID=3988 RepID=B9SC26_RICCO|nr:uncharacterized protein LOC8262857 [Ricinus communis]EEF38884.1 conserved hypothetical protein [Ricinus communis]|eukprot:XP_002523545.1 uncharacterized protein LOC8262857 [Ricinus communis]